MYRRPVSWPLVAIGLMAMGIGAVGMLLYFAGPSRPESLPVGSCVIALIGAASALWGWFHEPTD